MQTHDSKTVPALATPLSELFQNQALRDAFRRADRDNGQPFLVPAPRNPNLIGSAGASLKWRMMLEAA